MRQSQYSKQFYTARSRFAALGPAQIGKKRYEAKEIVVRYQHHIVQAVGNECYVAGLSSEAVRAWNRPATTALAVAADSLDSITCSMFIEGGLF